MRFPREMAVMALLIGCPGLGKAGASEPAPSRTLSITVVTEGSRNPFEAAVIAVATRHETGAWSSAGRMRTDAAGRSSLEIQATVTALHVLVVCPHGDRVLSGDAALDLTDAGSSPLTLEVSIESISVDGVRCSPAAEERVAAPRWPWPIPGPRSPRWPPRSPIPDPDHCDPLPCPAPKVDAT
jgi:hypothetical protein